MSMRPDDAVIFTMLLVVAIIEIPWTAFALASLVAGFPKLRLQQLLGIVGVFAWIFAYLASLGPSNSTALLVIGTVVAILLAFAMMWLREFPRLMARRADEFPERLDKLAWVFVLTVMAPAGVWLFLAYRRSRWPEAAKAAFPHPLDEPEADPEVDVPGMQRIGA
jgi:Flp pilus assembly protein TadB